MALRTTRNAGIGTSEPSELSLFFVISKEGLRVSSS